MLERSWLDWIRHPGPGSWSAEGESDACGPVCLAAARGELPQLASSRGVTVVALLVAFPARSRVRALMIRCVCAAFAVVAVGLLGGCGGSSSEVARLPVLHPDRVGPESMFTGAGDLGPDQVASMNALQRLGVQSVHVYMN